MSSKHKKIYQSRSIISPVVLEKKIEKISAELDKHKKTMYAVLESYNWHMDYLSKFARHDMGNAIQNISATLKTMEGKVAPNVIEALQSSINNLNSSLDNLGKLIHYSSNRTFRLSELINAVEVLVRESSQISNIRIITLVDRNDEESIFQPFQALLQLLHNLIINAQKSFKDPDKEKIIQIEANIDQNECVIKIKDTGCGIPIENINKIFEYGFTTTDGSGIGLFHAKYLCNEINGDISVMQNESGFSTIFILKFPKDGTKKNSGN